MAGFHATRNADRALRRGLAHGALAGPSVPAALVARSGLQGLRELRLRPDFLRGRAGVAEAGRGAVARARTPVGGYRESSPAGGASPDVVAEVHRRRAVAR